MNLVRRLRVAAAEMDLVNGIQRFLVQLHLKGSDVLLELQVHRVCRQFCLYSGLCSAPSFHT